MAHCKVHVKNRIIEKNMFLKKQLILNYKIEYPQFVSAGCQSAVRGMNRYYKEMALLFQQYCMQKLYSAAVEQFQSAVTGDFPFYPYQALVTYKLTYNQDCAVSLYFDQYIFSGGAHGSTVRYSDTWNMQNGRGIDISELFSGSVNYKAYMLMSINRQIAEQMKNGEKIYFENYKKNVAQHLNLSNYYLTKKGVIVYFQQYEIAPYSIGIPEFIIPYEEGHVSHPTCT